jgi:hypothetical protein
MDGKKVALVTAGEAYASASPPRVVADAIMKALSARRPRTRYAMGSGARAALWGRALLPDRAFDGVIRRMRFRSP